MFMQSFFPKRAASLALALTVTFGGGLLMGGCPPKDDPPPPSAVPPVAVAPGLIAEILKVDIPEDLRPEATIVITDNLGNRVPLNEITDLRLALAFLEDASGGGDATRFSNYTVRLRGGVTQATSDRALESAEQLADGSILYKFDLELPEDFDRSATHQVGLQVRRLYPIDGKVYPAEAIFRFRPDGADTVEVRELVATESCNKCHTRLEAHGGVRREIQHCILCHTPQTFDDVSGEGLDFAEMIHKIHSGVDLPSVQDGEVYALAGIDFSTVVHPQDVRNCAVCHDSSAASQADFHLTKPTLEGCASCHDRTWFGDKDTVPEGWTWHVGGAHADNRLCAQCHTPGAPGVSPVLEAHIIPTKSDAAPGLVLDVLDVHVAAPLEPGENGRLMVTFSASDKLGPITDLGALSSMAVLVGWPAPEYEANARESVVGGGGPAGTLLNNGDGTYVYTFATSAIPTNSGETFAVGLEGRRNFTFRGANYIQGTETNGLTFFTTDGSEPVVRRAIVAEEKCNTCHDEIRFHGAQRVGVDLCLICHNPGATDINRRPDGELPPVTVNFKDMIHKIHQGEDLEAPYTVYGFGGVPHDFTKVRFPGKLQQCSICHIDGTEQLPVVDFARSTLVTDGEGGVVTDMLPETASCTSCHDSITSVFHAQLQSDLLARAESCSVCHGRDTSFAVSVMHALNP